MKTSPKTNSNSKYQKILTILPTTRENIPLAPYTSFNIGGPADLFAEPKTQEELESLLIEVKKQNISAFILGGGSNTLFHDKGFRGLVIHPQLKKINVADDAIIAEAGVLLSQVVQTAAKHQLSGIEGWVGLPGTVGGAIRGNAGASGIAMKDFVSSVTIFDLKKLRTIEYSNEQLDFGYRQSIVKDNRQLLVLSATFTFKEKLATAQQQEKMKLILRKRQLTQPKGKSAGCVFKNPTRAQTSVDPDCVSEGISAGKLIDECGLKGLKIGGIEVSTIHGNFLQNTGNATQKDVLDAIKFIKKTVYKKRKIRLQEEVEIVPCK